MKHLDFLAWPCEELGREPLRIEGIGCRSQGKESKDLGSVYSQLDLESVRPRFR